MSGKLDIIIEQGGKFDRIIQIKDNDGNAVDITGNTFAGDIRKRYGSATRAEDFNISITEAVNGKISVSISSDSTAAMEAGEYVYDIHWTPSFTNTVRLLEGIAEVTPGVTR